MKDRTTQILCSQNSLIVKLLGESIHHGVKSEQGKRSFEQARKLVKKHLDLKKLRIYPKFKNQSYYVDLAKNCDNSMLELLKYLREIVDHCELGMSPDEFIGDFEKVLHRLSEQLKREESDLFRLYDQRSRVA